MRKLMIVVLAAAAFLGCDREERRFTEIAPSAGVNANAVQVAENQPGGAAIQPPAKPQYIDNAWAVSEGQRLYSQFNCAGCHSLGGGGGMGPPLMDDKWIYGGEPANIRDSIIEGRPNGMPSFRGKIPDQQVWQLVAYLNSLSGRARQDVASGRQENALSPHQPDVMMPPQDTKNAQHPQLGTGQKEGTKQ